MLRTYQTQEGSNIAFNSDEPDLLMLPIRLPVSKDNFLSQHNCKILTSVVLYHTHAANLHSYVIGEASETVLKTFIQRKGGSRIFNMRRYSQKLLHDVTVTSTMLTYCKIKSVSSQYMMPPMHLCVKLIIQELGVDYLLFYSTTAGYLAPFIWNRH